MSFSVSYVYKIIDKFTPKLREIEKATASFNAAILGAEQKMKGLNQAMKDANPAARQAERAIKKAAKGIDGMSGKGIRGRLSGIQNKMDGIATSASAVASSLGVGLGIKKAITDAIDYESSLSDVRRAISFANEEEFAAFQKTLEETGKKLAISKTAMNALAATAGRMEIPKEDMAEFATIAANMAIAFDGLTVDVAMKSISTLKTKLNLSMSQVKETADYINYIDDRTTASGSNMLQIMERLSGTFKTFKVPTNVAAGFAAIAEQLGASGPEGAALAASQMKMFVQKLMSMPGKSEALTKDFKGTIEKTLANLRAIPEGLRGGLIVEIFGENAAPFVMSLVESQDLYNRTMAVALDRANALGSAEREAAKRRETAAFKLEELKTALANMAIKIGEAVLPAIKEMAPVITKLAADFGDFMKNNPEFAKFAVLAAVVVTAIAPLALAIGGIASALGVVFSPLGALIALFATLYAKSESFRESITKIGRAMKNILGAVFAGSFDKAREYLMRDVNYEYDSNGAKIMPGSYDKLDSSGFQEFLQGQGLASQKEMNINLGGSINLSGPGAASVTGATLGSSMGGNLGFNIARPTK